MIKSLLLLISIIVLTFGKVFMHPAEPKPIFGYRFQIFGDFNGDGIKDTLTEHFYSLRDHKETNKYFSEIDDYFVMYDSAYKRECVSYMLCSDHSMDTIPIRGVLGPLWVKNEGDLNGDGRDDISFVESSPGASSITHCFIISYKHHRWKELYRFEIREWQLPPLPDGGKVYGLFGAEDFITTDNDSINVEMQKQLDEFPGLITKVKPGKIKVQTFTEEAIDTVLVVKLK